MFPVAPVRFSTTTGLANALESLCPMAPGFLFLMPLLPGKAPAAILSLSPYAVQCKIGRTRSRPRRAPRSRRFESATTYQSLQLFRLDAGLADDFGPALELGLDDAPELLRAAAYRVRALLKEFLLHFRQVHHPGDFLLHARDDRLWRLCRREQREPGIHLVVGEVQLFGDGRDLRRRRIALERGHRERPQFPGAHGREPRGRCEE